MFIVVLSPIWTQALVAFVIEELPRKGGAQIVACILTPTNEAS